MTFWRKWLPSRKPAPSDEATSAGPSDTSANEAFAAELESIGWFRFVAPSELAAARQALVETGYPIDDATGRSFHADAEALPPPNEAVTALRLAPLPENPLLAVTEHYYEEDGDEAEHYLIVGERAVLLCENAEQGDSWELVTHRAFSFLNEVLSACSSEERLWGHMGGNDLHAVFATSAQARSVNERHPDTLWAPRSL